MSYGHVLIVAAYVNQGEEARFDRWFADRDGADSDHVSGVRATRYFRSAPVKAPAGVDNPDLVVLYDIVADNPHQVVTELRRRVSDASVPAAPWWDDSRTLAFLAAPDHVAGLDGTSTGAALSQLLDHRAIFFAATYAKPGRQTELLTCYDDEHIPDLLAIPGIGVVVRFAPEAIATNEAIRSPTAILLHEFDPGDPMAILDEVKARTYAGRIRHTAALDGAESIVLLLTPLR